MSRQTKDLWIARRRRAVELAEELVSQTGNKFPVNLGRIAQRRLVRSVELRPLLIDGGLAVLKNGFIIYVKCGAGEGDDLTEKFAQDGIGTKLPTSMIHRARFTIAHEIAHTFFYKINSEPPEPKFELKTVRSVASLERACNLTAGVLLLPESILEGDFANVDLSRPENLSNLADSALVSKHVLVRRFQQLRRFSHPPGIIVCVIRRDNNWVIDSISRHYSLREMFSRAIDNAPLSELIDHPDFLPFGGEMSEVDVEVVCTGGKIRIMRFECDPVIRFQQRGSFFVTARYTVC